MRKRILYAILTLCILLAFAACNILVEGPSAESTGSPTVSDTEPETTESETTEPETTEPETTEPETTEPETTEPETTEPETTEPETTEPETTEPETTEPETTEPETTEPETTEPETTEPETTEPETTEPETTEPETTEPETTEPETTEPETTEPETTEPETTEPETTEPETTEPEITESQVTYIFSNYEKGEQYAKNEVHVLDSILTVVTNDGYFTDQIRLYQSATVIFSSTKIIESMTVNAGYKADKLQVWGSTDGENWTLIDEISVVKSYADYEVNMSGKGYTYILLEATAVQIRVASITMNYSTGEVIPPEETEPETTEPAETEPAETEPAETEPAETESAETESAETESAETESERPSSLPQHAGTENDPYTVSDALIVLGTLVPDSSNSATSRVYVEGIVIDAGTLKNNKYISGITITDGTGSSLTLYINTANPETVYDFDLYVGDKILLNGFLRTYIDKYGETILEMGSSNGEYTYFTITEYDDASGGGGGSDENETSGNIMPEQIYKPDNHQKNDDILHDAINDYVANDPNNGNQLAIGLPAQGTYSALVIPVQFPNDSFTQSELSDLELAFNGTSAQTGWQSVSSYYSVSSFGKLNLSFDIYDPITMNKNSSAYETSDTGAEDILKYVLDILDPTVDLSQYDTNDDGYIDAVYLIYSVPMDYENDNSNYWAFVSWNFSGAEYDGVGAHYYLFASIDFMYDDTEDSGSEYAIDGLKLNAVTYIHETGHLLGLDDYYDYNEGVGADRGLGNSDMMDSVVGDHNVYSKLMLGWVNPTVVTSSQQLTITSSTESGQFIMILLDYDGTYFSEYLLIDLYTATGLNKFHAEQPDSLLYGDENDPDFAGAAYGARIYHISSSIDNPFNDEYYSFTDNNNSISSIPLIKLIEADGDENYESDIFDGYRYASADDLWQSGDSLGSSQPNYTRNNGNYLNFDIFFDSVSAAGATITITFN